MQATRRSVLAATMALAVAGTARAQDDPLAETRAWLRLAARPFAPEPRTDADLTDLVETLSRSRLVGLGEATHGTHEDFQLKADVIAAMARQGRIEVLVLEANRAPAEMRDAWVMGRDPADVETALVESNLFEIWRCREVAGLLTALRAYNETAERPVRIVGCDVQTTDVDLDLALARLEAHDAEAAAAFRAQLGEILPGFPTSRRTSDLTGLMTVDQMADGLAIARELEARLTGLDAEGAYAARVGRQGLESFEYDVSGADPALQTPDYWARRDQYMALNTIDLLSDRAGALWAHNSHVLAEAVGGFEPLGARLRTLMGDAYASVIFEFESARFNAVPQPDPNAYPPRGTPAEVLSRGRTNGSFGAFLGDVGPDRFWVSLRDAPEASAAMRAHTFSFDWPGWTAPINQSAESLSEGQLAGTTDVVMFVRHMEPSQRLSA